MVSGVGQVGYVRRVDWVGKVHTIRLDWHGDLGEQGRLDRLLRLNQYGELGWPGRLSGNFNIAKIRNEFVSYL